jgi:DNA-binding NtrC family response regulator
MQTHLLRVLQDGTFRSLGDNEEISVDVRILSASNRDLEDEIKAGRFREDLFYRLNVVRIDVPPLSERRDDIPLLVEHLAERHTGGRAPTFSKEAMDALMGAEWPGNVRELENEVLRAITMAGDSNTITVDDLSPRLTRGSAGEMFTGQGSLKDRVNQFEGVIIKRVLEECDDNATKAAAALGISRATLYKKLERFGIDRS